MNLAIKLLMKDYEETLVEMKVKAAKTMIVMTKMMATTRKFPSPQLMSITKLNKLTDQALCMNHRTWNWKKILNRGKMIQI